MNKFVLLIFILILAVSGSIFFTIQESLTDRRRDGFSNYNLEVKNDNNSSSESDLLVKDMYPPTGSLGISNNTANDIWWHKPVFKLGSYEQITNNIRYSNNPDVGSCMPPSMCGALYHDNQIKTNYSKILPQLNPGCGTRVGYFDTNSNFLEFKTDMQNILY
jgi:hypothetical protein